MTIALTTAEPLAQKETRLARAALVWALLAWAGFALLPWYWTANMGLFDWLGRVAGEATGSALFLSTAAGKWWLLPFLLPLAAALRPLGPAASRLTLSSWLIAAGGLGLAWLAFVGFGIGLRGWNAEWLAAILGAPGPRQIGMGAGAGLTGFAFLMILCQGLAARGWCRGDAFITGSIGAVIGLVGLFVFLPVFKILVSAVQDNDGALALSEFSDKLLDRNIWGLGCFGGGIQCGVAWNTIFLALFVGVAATLLGLSFALIATRSGFRFKGALRVLTILPIITPPFVIGLALILLFGRNGAVTLLLSDLLGIPRSRWIYGFSGVALAQVLAFTPLAFLVLVGVVQGISPTLEEASQTLRASRWTTFRTVTWPLMRPGLANAFLLCFVESMADFGNPLVLGGNFDVLSIRVFFAVVGAAHDQGRAAVLAIVLLAFTLAAFFAQNAWLGKKVYTTVSGKGDAGLPIALPRRVAAACYGTALPWALFTILIYVTIFLGGFVEAIGRDYTPTLKHYLIAFGIESTPAGWFFSGSAWDSFSATIEVSAIAAPLTAAMGLVTAYLLARQTFRGKRAFEFGTLLSFAIPGTVIGVGYILAFNVPPIEITGTALILVLCFIFRNMPVGVRAGLATLSQIDKSLDEASLTLGARSFTTFRRVVLPLLRPAIVAGLVYSFVRAMTAVSAVIFLVSARYNMATAYIVGRADAGEYGVAIAYSSALIVVMLAVITLIQLAVGERRLGRRTGQIALGQ
jgi:iron(III) transport system permease protein